MLASQAEYLQQRYGVAFSVVGAADSSGAVIEPGGFDPVGLLAAKERGGVAGIERVGRRGMSAIELVETVQADIVLEATPVDLRTGEPGLGVTRAALRRGMSVVLANKGPLALHYTELAGLSDLTRAGAPALRFSACVGGAMPTINLGIRDLAGARVLRVEAVLNGTSQFMLRSMELGQTYEAALADAQRRGLTETDPSLDVDGWDAAAKLVILVNAVLQQPATIRDVDVEGIKDVGPAALAAAAARGERIVLLCLAEPDGRSEDRFRSASAPQRCRSTTRSPAWGPMRWA